VNYNFFWGGRQTEVCAPGAKNHRYASEEKFYRKLTCANLSIIFFLCFSMGAEDDVPLPAGRFEQG